MVMGWDMDGIIPGRCHPPLQRYIPLGGIKWEKYAAGVGYLESGWTIVAGGRIKTSRSACRVVWYYDIIRSSERDWFSGQIKMANQRLRNILKYDEMEYPKVSVPLESVKLLNNALVSTFRGHVVLSLGVGIFLDNEFDSESKASEFSAEYVVNMRKNDNN